MSSLAILVCLGLLFFFLSRTQGEMSKRELLDFAQRPLARLQPRNPRSAKIPAQVIGGLLAILFALGAAAAFA